MKKILILRDENKKNKREIALDLFLKKYFKNRAVIEVKKLKDVFIEMAPGKIRVGFDKKDARGYDLIWIRKTGGRFIDLATGLGLCFDFLGVKYFDTTFGKRALGGNKLLLFLNLAKNNLPIPKSFYLFSQKVAKYREQIVAELGFPLVGKLMEVHWGGGVFILRNRKEFDQFVRLEKNRQLIFQKFHPHRGDYRILVLGYKVGAWEKMWRQPDLKLGSVEGLKPVGDLKKKEFYPVSKIPPKMADLAIRAAKAVSLEVAGVDILEDSNTGEYLMTEVNRTPAMAIDYPGDPELKAIASFLEKSVGL